MTLHTPGEQVHHHEAALRDSEVEIGRLAHHGGIDGPGPLHRDGHGSVAGFLAVTEYDQEATAPTALSAARSRAALSIAATDAFASPEPRP
jgi:hypothetical protein